MFTRRRFGLRFNQTRRVRNPTGNRSGESVALLAGLNRIRKSPANMSTATPPASRIARPRLSLLVVEGALTAVAAVLLAWLLLWFIHQRARELRIEALYVAPADEASADVLFQAADVRRLGGDAATAGPGGVAAKDLEARVVEIVSRPGPAVVVYISDPVVGPPDAVPALIERVVQSAGRDVVLALDLSQIDSDRDLGVYGNSPYDGLAEKVEQMKKGERCVCVLTSSAPAQKSWGAEGLGQSAFAHFLQKGLEGRAERWDGESPPGRVSVQGLHRYVRRHVAAWARSRRDAIQTPQLLTIGADARTISLPLRKRVASPPPAAPAAPVEPPPSKAEAPVAGKDATKLEPAKEEPREPADPRDAAFEALMAEWDQHDALRKIRPYAAFPEHWRLYQGALLRAERRLRAAWRDPSEVGAVRKALREIELPRAELARALDQARASAGDFPVRPARGEKEGRRTVTESLRHLTGQPPKGGLFEPPDVPKAPPAEAGKAEKPEASRAPDGLNAVASGGPLGPFLELQLAAWAVTFAREFNLPGAPFKDDDRGEILRNLVEVRSVAEEAIAVDRRGLEWIRPFVVQGDRDRRDAQDELFGPESTSGGLARDVDPRLAQINFNYGEAKKVIDEFHNARDVWEQAAAELPELGEWAVRAEGGKYARTVDRALDAATRLINELDWDPAGGQRAQFAEPVQKHIADMREAADVARTALAELGRHLREFPRGDRPDDWIAIDAALRTPLLPGKERRAFLRAILDREDPLDDLGAESGETGRPHDAPDLGFRRRAVGLARLDRDLRRLGRGDRSEAESAYRFLDEAWSAVQAARETAEAIDGGPLRKYGEEASNDRRAGARELAGRHRSVKPKPGELKEELRRDDRAVRLLCGREIRLVEREGGALGDVARAREKLDQYNALAFHLERLREDYAPATAVDFLRARLVELVEALQLDEQVAPWETATIRPDSRPIAPAPLEIDADGKAPWSVQVASPEQGRPGAVPIPSGRAFVGAATPPPGLRIGGEGAAAGEPPGGLRAVGSAAPPGQPVRFTVYQTKLDLSDAALPVQAKVFYRGRVDRASVVELAVKPRRISEPIVLEISQDRDAWKQAFPRVPENRFRDQFLDHPREGYMHKGKDLAYVLTFKNLAFDDLVIEYQRFLDDPAAPGQWIPIEAQPTEKVVKRGDENALRISDKMTSQLTPMLKGRKLKVAWKVKSASGGGKESAHDRIFLFHQIPLRRYVTIETGTGEKEHYKEIRRCHWVIYKRHSDDPVTDPILADELGCTIGNLVSRITPNYILWPGGQELLTTKPCGPGEDQFSWKGKIGNEELPPKESP